MSSFSFGSFEFRFNGYEIICPLYKFTILSTREASYSMVLVDWSSSTTSSSNKYIPIETKMGFANSSV